MEYKKIIILFKAWLVHILTACGTIVAFYSIIFIVESNYKNLLKAITIGLMIDSIDGTFARKFKVKKNLPFIDGTLIDNIVDYLNYAFIPAVFFYYSACLNENFKIHILIGVLLASIYQFSRTDAKTEDAFFKGFPSLWNFIVIIYIIFDTSSLFNTLLTLACIIFSFVPIKVIYPTRTKAFRLCNILTSFIFLIALIIVSFYNLSELYLGIVQIILISFLIYGILVSLYLTYKHKIMRIEN